MRYSSNVTPYRKVIDDRIVSSKTNPARMLERPCARYKACLNAAAHSRGARALPCEGCKRFIPASSVL